ncbi:uncharacterized protein LOC107267448 [Cephus cinctus]|uniref:Uncharacterized protein LOC107267448 n=1 Tax=Cephus cinctus TaxID=211228 RepID=A0AAJ7FJC1_CEPCN|nr:uncharacterized protein LOC107267448 [Cephus cinctus]
MADNRQLVEDSKRQESNDSLLSEEWMIIDETEDNSETNEMTRLEICNYKDNEDDAENMQNNADMTYEKHDAGKSDSDDAAEKLIDDSDEISIITESTESDNEQLVIGKEISNINKINEASYACTDIQKLNQADDKIVSQVGAIFNIIIACSLAAVIGLGAGRILSIDECTISNDVDFASVKMKNDILINQLKELNGVKDVLDEIRSSIPKVTSGDRTQSDSFSDDVTNGNMNSKNFDKSDRKQKINADSKIVERLKNSLENLCSVIDDIIIDNSRPFTKQLCESQNVVKDLMIFEKIISEVLRDSREETSEIRVLQNAEKKISNVCRSLLVDLSNTVHGIATKTNHKLEKVSLQMKKKLCTLQKEANSEFLKKLPSSNNFFANCEKTLNITHNSEKSAKVVDITKGTLKSSDNSEYNKRQRTWKNKNRSTSKKPKTEFLNTKFYYRYEEDTCSSPQFPWFTTNSKNDIKFDQKLDTEHVCTSKTGDNAKKFNVKQSDKMSKGSNTAHVKSSKNMWNKKIRDSRILKKHIDERRDSKMSDSSENVQDHSKDTYASKVVNLKNKMDYGGREIHEPRSNKEECSSTGKACLKQKISSKQTGDNVDLKDSKSPNRNSKQKFVKRKRVPKMDKHLTENESHNPPDNVNRDMYDGEWQLQRSKAREILRDRERASDWYFDRAGSRKDARKYEDEPELINDNHDEEWEDSWMHSKDVRHGGKRDSSHAFSSKKTTRSTFKTHRQNIMKERRR